MACMSHDEKIESLRKQISQTEQQLGKLKQLLRQLEETTEPIESKMLKSFEDFPKNFNLWRAIMRNTWKIEGRTLRTTESATVEHLLRMSPEELLKQKGVGPGVMKRLTDWMDKHNLSFVSESGLIYTPIGEAELLSTFDYLWDEWLPPRIIGVMNAELQIMAGNSGKHYCSRYNYRGFLKDVSERNEVEADDNYTIGDFLRTDLVEFQRRCGFDELTIEKIKECMKEHGLKFINE